MVSSRASEVLVTRGTDRHVCRLGVSGTRDEVILEFDGPAGYLEFPGYDVLDALVKLRASLEKDGWLLAVQGARLNAHASRMMRDMADGKRVYLMTGNRGPYPAADTLAPADPDQVGTLEEQARHVRAILDASLPSSRDDES